MICSASVVPERGMPTMKTGAGSRFCARGPSCSRARSNRGDRRVEQTRDAPRARTAESGRAAGVPRIQWAKARSGSRCCRPEWARSKCAMMRCSGISRALLASACSIARHALRARRQSPRPAPAARAATASAAPARGGTSPIAAITSRASAARPTCSSASERCIRQCRARRGSAGTGLASSSARASAGRSSDSSAAAWLTRLVGVGDVLEHVSSNCSLSSTWPVSRRKAPRLAAAPACPGATASACRIAAWRLPNCFADSG